MKKSIIFLILIFLIVVFSLVSIFSDKKEKNNLKEIKLVEVTHSIFYAPLYVSIEKGYFKDEGIDLKLTLTSGADKVSAAVLSNDADVGFAGLESSIYVYNGGEKDYLQSFCGLTKRDGQFIIGKNDKAFSLKDLVGKEILVGRKGGMPALNFLNALKNEGIDQNEININYQIDFASLSGAFIGGTGEYVNLFEPNASMLEKNKQGYVLDSVGKYSGEMPYTVFYSRKSYIKDNKELLIKFNKAIDKGLLYVKNHDAKDIAKVISKQFPDNSINDLEMMIKNYKDADSWLQNHNISKTSYKNLENLLKDNGLIKDFVPYNKLVINLNE